MPYSRLAWTARIVSSVKLSWRMILATGFCGEQNPQNQQALMFSRTGEHA